MFAWVQCLQRPRRRAKSLIYWDRQGRHYRARCGDHLVSEQPASDKMRIRDGVFELHYDGGTAIGGGEYRVPFLCGPARDNAGDGGPRRRGIEAIVNERRRKSDCVAKREPEFLFQCRTGDELAVASRIELIAGRPAGQARRTWCRKADTGPPRPFARTSAGPSSPET